jgi:c-di-GMP-binding flagellar brake protein YcgR
MTDARHNKRKHRRYRGNVLKRVDAALQTPDGQSYDGRLDDVSIAGAAIRLAANAAPQFKLGQIITITLHVPLPNHGHQIVDIPAEIRNLTPEDDTGSLRCGLKFDRHVEAGSAFYSALRALANRRAETRVAPAHNEKITMVLKTGDGAEVEGSVQDISAHGARVLVGGEFAKDSIGLDAIALSFQLPSEDHETSMTGIIRNQRVNQEETYLGVQFDDAGSPNFTARQREIMRYLMRRQRELIRK